MPIFKFNSSNAEELIISVFLYRTRAYVEEGTTVVGPCFALPQPARKPECLSVRVCSAAAARARPSVRRFFRGSPAFFERQSVAGAQQRHTQAHYSGTQSVQAHVIKPLLI